MNSDLHSALMQERSIFRVFSTCENIGSFEAFHSPNLDEVPHWNMAYPISIESTPATKADLLALADYYQILGIVGHLATADTQYKSFAAEEAEYFALFGPPTIEASWQVNEFTHQDQDLNLFCDVIQRCFSLTDQTANYFHKKMTLLSERDGSKFFVVKKGDDIIGCCSTFRTDSGADFMFNVATVPEANGRGVAKSVVAYAAVQSKRPLFTYSHNPKMRESILPDLGFKSIGTLYCVPLAHVR